MKSLHRPVLAEWISLAFTLLFIYTGTSKFLAMDALQHVFTHYPLIRFFPHLFAWMLPLTELLVAALLFFRGTNTRALAITLVMMIGFTIYVAAMLLYTPQLPCTCGGLFARLSWPQHLTLNILLTGLAAAAIRIKRSEPVSPHLSIIHH